MKRFRDVIGWLLLMRLPACVASQPGVPTPGLPQSAPDRLLTRGDIHVAEAHLNAFGYDPGPIDGLLTAETPAAVRAFQVQYGLAVSGRLDRQTRLESLPGLDQDEFDP